MPGKGAKDFFGGPQGDLHYPASEGEGVPQGDLHYPAYPTEMPIAAILFPSQNDKPSAGAGRSSALPMRMQDPSPPLDQNLAPMDEESLYNTGARVWRKAPGAFPDSSSVLDKFESAREDMFWWLFAEAPVHMWSW